MPTVRARKRLPLERNDVYESGGGDETGKSASYHRGERGKREARIVVNHVTITSVITIIINIINEIIFQVNTLDMSEFYMARGTLNTI